MANLHEYEEEFWELTEESRALMPDLNAAYYGGIKDAVFNDSEPGLKTKRLVALGIAVQNGCEPCIISQVNHALNQGATVKEIIGACSVAISMGGTLAWSNLLTAIKYLREKGLIPKET
ncbi:MAG: carboxymuconolactone decarboxylase family protein [Desulfonatronovibrionaceae bacterium]